MTSLPLNWNSYPDQQRLLRAAASDWIACAQQAIRERGRFCVALTGGSTPEPLYQMLAEDEYAGRVDWSKVYFFWGDERMVANDAKDSNYRMAKAAMLDRLPVDSAQIFPMVQGEHFDTETIERYVQSYTAAIQQHVKMNQQGWPEFDLIMLGMGADGHTASLFPDTDILKEENKPVAKVYVDKLNSWRMSLTYPVFEACNKILLMVCGQDKATVVGQIFNHEQLAEAYPIQRLAFNDSVHWYLDDAAASRIKG